MPADYLDPIGGIFRLIDFIGYMTKQPFDVECSAKTREYKVPSKILLTPAYFRSDKCQCCGKCCNKPYTLVWTERDWKERVLKAATNDFDHFDIPMTYYVQLLQNVDQVTVRVGQNYSKFMVYKQTKGCQLKFLDNDLGRCGIHPVKPIGCALPLTIFTQMSKTKATYIRKQPHGRNWRLGCPIKFGEFDYNEFKSWDLPWLNRLAEMAADMQVETYLPELLTFFNDADACLKKGMTPLHPINFMAYENQVKLF